MQRRDLFPLAAGLLAGAVAPGLARAADKKTLALVTNGSSDFWTFARRGIEKAQAELPNYTMELHVLAQSTAAEQKQVLDDLLTRGVAGVSVSAIDPTNETDILNKVASQAVLFTTDSDAASSKRVLYIGTDNVAAGVQAGQLINMALPKNLFESAYRAGRGSASG
jgi:ribose transport system substrate-binding protein